MAAKRPLDGYETVQQACIARYEAGERPTDIAKLYGIKLATVGHYLNRMRKRTGTNLLQIKVPSATLKKLEAIAEPVKGKELINALLLALSKRPHVVTTLLHMQDKGEMK